MLIVTLNSTRNFDNLDMIFPKQLTKQCSHQKLWTQKRFCIHGDVHWGISENIVCTDFTDVFGFFENFLSCLGHIDI